MPKKPVQTCNALSLKPFISLSPLGNPLLLAAAVVAIIIGGGCVRHDEVGEKTQYEAILFETESPLLKEDLTKTPLPYASQFGVFAFMQNDLNWSKNKWTPNMMFNKMVSVIDNNGNCGYNNLVYWPSSTNKVSFWSYYPYNESASLCERGKYSTYTVSSKDVPDIRFTVDDGQTDLMVSGLVRNKKSSDNSGVVSLAFNHVLSLIDFTILKAGDVNDDFTIILRSISFENIYLTGVYRNNFSSYYDSRDSYWDLRNSLRRSLPVYTGTQEVTSSDSPVLHNTNELSIMPIPQTLVNTEARLRIVYSLSATGLGISETTNVFDFPFSGDWQPNHHYTYSFQITPNYPIQFTVSCSEWGTAHTIDLTN